MSNSQMTRSAGILGELKIPYGLGLLRLSTEGRPEEQQAIELIHFALDSGFRLLDTAESYGLSDKDLHYGESLARKAVESWSGPKDEVKIITKVGMARPKGKWKPAASDKAITKGVEGSLKALGVERLFLVQLHVKDSRVPFEESLASLARLQKEGKIEHIGLCNVGPLEVRQAQRHFPVVAVQSELSVISQATAKHGMLELTKNLGIPFLASRPLGGYAKVDKLLKNRTLKPVAARYDVPPHEIALKTLLEAAPHIIPLVGATRRESLESCLRALHQPLDKDDHEQLAKKFTFPITAEAERLIAERVTPEDLPSLEPNQGPGDSPELVLVTGVQGAGKSELVESYLEQGYQRLNRDELGGSLNDLVEALEKLFAEGEKRVVMDNTYPTRVSRSPVITVAHAHGIPVRCKHLNTPASEATINVCLRVLDRYGELLGPDELKEKAKVDPNLPPPAAMRQYGYIFEAPALDEGFSAVDEIDFERRPNPGWTNKGLILDVDGTLRITKSGEIYPRHPEDVELLPDRKKVLQQWIEAGYSLYFLSNQSGVHSEKLTSADADACFARTIELLDLPVEEVTYCPHRAFPVSCFCRKPMPGLGVYLMRKYELDHSQMIMVGDMASDEKFAEDFGITYYHADTFFGEDRPTPA